jgi:transcriptional regulator
MYLPSHFAWTDRADQLAFCRANAFATVVHDGPDGPEVQHVPLLADDVDGRLVLHGHVAIGDPLWKAAKALAIFTGPHAYISAAWYGEGDLPPTWNYLAVHAAGPLTVITDAPTIANLFVRLAGIDPEREIWQARMSPAAYARLNAGLRWFRIDADRVTAKAKLSQHHTPERRRKAIARLLASNDPNDQATGRAMQRSLDGLPPWGGTPASPQ